MFVDRVSELELLEKRFHSGKAELLFYMATGGLARSNCWYAFAKANGQFSLFQTWVRRYLSGRLYPLRAI